MARRVLLAVVTLAGVACGPGAAEKERWAAMAAAGREAYEAESCGACHGATLGGSRTGPPLQGLASEFTEDELVSLLRDPARWVRDDARVARLAKRFPGRMSGLPAADEQRLRSLAAYLLSR